MGGADVEAGGGATDRARLRGFLAARLAELEQTATRTHPPDPQALDLAGTVERLLERDEGRTEPSRILYEAASVWVDHPDFDRRWLWRR